MILFGDLVSLTPAQSLIRLLSFLLWQKINKNEKKKLESATGHSTNTN